MAGPVFSGLPNVKVKVAPAAAGIPTRGVFVASDGVRMAGVALLVTGIFRPPAIVPVPAGGALLAAIVTALVFLEGCRVTVAGAPFGCVGPEFSRCRLFGKDSASLVLGFKRAAGLVATGCTAGVLARGWTEPDLVRRLPSSAVATRSMRIGRNGSPLTRN